MYACVCVCALRYVERVFYSSIFFMYPEPSLYTVVPIFHSYQFCKFDAILIFWFIFPSHDVSCLHDIYISFFFIMLIIYVTIFLQTVLPLLICVLLYSFFWKVAKYCCKIIYKTINIFTDKIPLFRLYGMCLCFANYNICVHHIK